LARPIYHRIVITCMQRHLTSSHWYSATQITLECEVNLTTAMASENDLLEGGEYYIQFSV